MTTLEASPGTGATGPAAMTRAEAEDFVYHEARLLDDGRHRDWLDLFSADGMYWIPSNDADHDPARHVAIVYDNVDQLRARISRYETGRVVQELPSRTLHVVTNVTVAPAGTDGPDDEVVLECAVVVHEVHVSRKSYYPGRCTYRLRRTPDGWRIVFKKLALIDNDLFYDGLAFMF